MKKFALLFLVAVVSFGFVGCASSLERQWGLEERGFGNVQELQKGVDESGQESYAVCIFYGGRISQQHFISKSAYSQMEVGGTVLLKLDHYVTSGGKVVMAVYELFAPGISDSTYVIFR